MRKILFLPLILLMLSCGEDAKEIIASNITVEAYYTTIENPNKLIPDVGARVFVYYDFYSLELAEYTFRADGSLANGDSIIAPNQKAVVDANGKVILTPLYYNKKFIILVESSYYQGRIAHSSYTAANTSVTQRVITKK